MDVVMIKSLLDTFETTDAVQFMSDDTTADISQVLSSLYDLHAKLRDNSPIYRIEMVKTALANHQLHNYVGICVPEMLKRFLTTQVYTLPKAFEERYPGVTRFLVLANN